MHRFRHVQHGNRTVYAGGCGSGRIHCKRKSDGGRSGYHYLAGTRSLALAAAGYNRGRPRRTYGKDEILHPCHSSARLQKLDRSPDHAYGINELGTDDAQKTWDLNVTFMRELLACAKEHDVIICFENMPMPNFSLGSVEAIRRFVREMDDDHFRVCLDTGHVNVFEGQSLYDAVIMIGDKLQTLHVHDNNGRSDEHRMPWFGGTADWEGFGRALREIGFDGVFSYETGPSRTLPLDLYGDMLRFMVKSVGYILPK